MRKAAKDKAEADARAAEAEAEATKIRAAEAEAAQKAAAEQAEADAEAAKTAEAEKAAVAKASAAKAATAKAATAKTAAAAPKPTLSVRGQPASKPAAAAGAAKVDPAARRTPARGTTKPGGMVLRTLSDEEKDARLKALTEAKAREADDRRRAAEAAQRREEEDARRQALREERAREEAEAEAAKKAAEEAKIREAAEERARERASQQQEAAPAGPRALKPAVRRPREAPSRTPSKRDGGDRQRGRLTVTTALSGGTEERGRSLASYRRRQQRMMGKGANAEPKEKIAREVQLPETITIQELANRMSERAVDVIKLLMQQGQMMKATDILDADTAELIATEMGHTVRRVSEADVQEGLFEVDDEEETLVSRPPVVTIMGHVDHGKTSLLDAIRETNVTSGEAGGITQHIGAYQVEQNGQKITFIDTPGHAAFTAMRARGANATDIVILVVAANDGVMPQTIEAINHAKAAGVPIIVAINKIDLPEADANRVKTDLLRQELVVESMGGDIQEVEVSALKKQNLDGLLEAILLQAEILEQKANPDRQATGVVIESRLDKGRGTVATVLVQGGTLKKGDILVAGQQWGRVRALLDDQGRQVDEALPAMPVEVLGFNGAPEAGEPFAVVEEEAKAREVAEYRERQARDLATARQAKMGSSLEDMMNQIKVDGRQTFPVVIKGDVQGSVEAITQSLEKLSTDEVEARVLHTGVGAITESDITLATASGAVILGFNVRANAQARDAAKQSGIEIRYYNIIYDLLDDMKGAMSGLLAPEIRETFIGYAEILEVFNITKVGKVAGCRVTEGIVERGSGVRLLRDNVVVHEGKLSTLKRFKDEVKEVNAGTECGMAFEKYEDMRQGDMIECFRVESIARTL
ncbi:MAG: translation initiation factor IF-2 [Pseudomonadota bacterium]